MSKAPFLGRLPKGADLLEALTAVCREQNITRGAIALIGAVEKASLGFYYQDTKKYVSHDFPENLEILSGLGNVSLKDGQPFAHLHLILGRENGESVGGHAMPGCVIFACEVCITPIEGPDLVREFDEPTGLPLWKQN